ncbi:MAG TPA: hypothetical protein VJS64_11685 [Pyrinomonadaceae bacterium]|nr:hypothetical protein [Pyrinomonadaceae bacterium]
MVSRDKKAALVIAHPGHELRVFHWLELVKPDVFVLTDGSGHVGHSRLSSTSKVLQQVGAKPGSFFGCLTDAAAYAAILDHHHQVFINLARTLASHLLKQQVEYVVGDALEGYNPVHDACRIVIGAAVKMANSAGQKTEDFAFPLIGSPDGSNHCNGAIHLELDEDAFGRKMAVARAYAELESEVNEAIKENKSEAFRVECLKHVSYRNGDHSLSEKPYYESYGEQQVATGHYTQVIRYRKHFEPLAEALWRAADQGV